MRMALFFKCMQNAKRRRAIFRRTHKSYRKMTVPPLVTNPLLEYCVEKSRARLLAPTSVVVFSQQKTHAQAAKTLCILAFSAVFIQNWTRGPLSKNVARDFPIKSETRSSTESSVLVSVVSVAKKVTGPRRADDHHAQKRLLQGTV